MNLHDRLEILLITYNRKALLQKTMEQLLAANSPIKDLSITVIDNCSTDGTDEYMHELSVQHANIKHIRNTRNIGGNANIARAFELAQKEYFWILADDDEYDFTHWDEVEKAIEQKAALIVVNTEEMNGEKDLLKAFRRLTFLPASIFRSDLLTDATLKNIYDTVPTWFPHLAVICAVFNDHLPIVTCQHNIVKQANRNTDNYKSLRVNKHFTPTQQNTFFDVGLLNAMEMLTDKKMRAKAVRYFAYHPNFFHSVKGAFKCNRLEHHNYSRNLTGPWAALSFWQRIQFATAILYLDICYILKYPKYYWRRKRKQKNEKTSL